MDNERIKDFIHDYYNPLLKNSLKERLHTESVGRGRNPHQRDYSRILYSSSFRRLQGKMQLLGVQHDKFYRNRLTHSLEVSQIARGIAERLREVSGCEEVYKNDLYVIEAAALAHDIGNAPFGHHGERILNKIMEKDGGFEGNAQTLRVLNKLEKKLPNQKGLNLTKRTLLSVVKYYNTKGLNNEKFIYDEDYKIIKNISESENVNPRTIDVQIMDLADEIAYGAHDLEDALSLNLFTIDEFLYEFQIGEDVTESAIDTLKSLIDAAKEVANRASNYNSSEEYAFLFRKELISNIVNKLILDIDVVPVTSKLREETGTMNNHELGFKKHKNFAKSLKKLTFKCINRSNIVQIYEKQGEKIIKGLFEAFMDDKFNKDRKLLPKEFRSEDNRARAVTDYIAGMMDSYAIKVYQDIFGESALDRIYELKYFMGYNFDKFNSEK